MKDIEYNALGEVEHYDSHDVGGLLVAIRTVARSTIDLSVSAQPLGNCDPQTLFASGCLMPALASEPIAVTYAHPSGVETTHVVLTDAQGCFEDQADPEGGGGLFKVSAFWHGDLLNSSVTAVGQVLAADPADTDCDGTPDAEDNCDGLYNPTQQDVDGDFYGDDCDCAPGDPGAWQLPAEIVGLRFDSSTRLTWNAANVQSGDATVHEIVRGAVDDLPQGASYDDSCLVAQVEGDFFDDTELPSTGEGWWYLVRGVNACGIGTLGWRSSGLERHTAAVCAACAHDKCVQGTALDPSCDDCVHQICDADPFCCSVAWDDLCEHEVLTECDSFLCEESQGSCSHTLCSQGPPLTPSCDAPPASESCVDMICAVDPFCCSTMWDGICVDEVETVCGMNCH